MTDAKNNEEPFEADAIRAKMEQIPGYSRTDEGFCLNGDELIEAFGEIRDERDAMVRKAMDLEKENAAMRGQCQAFKLALGIVVEKVVQA